MGISSENFIAARKASNMTLNKAAELANITVPTYVAREKHPEQFRLCELEPVFQGLTPLGKSLLKGELDQIFLLSKLR